MIPWKLCPPEARTKHRLCSESPRRFVELAEAVACHRSPARWQLLYRVLYRLTHGQPHLMDIATDDDIHQLMMMDKQISRDCHKMKAFVRFRRVISDGGQEHFVAWHRPDHRVVRRVAPFFSRRFVGMNWTILTPDESATWDGHELAYGPGMPRTEAPEGDDLESLWKTYYGSTFNPARIKLAMMRKEMPVRHWATLPETAEIDRLLEEAPQRVARMVAYAEGSAASAKNYLPTDTRDYLSLKQAASACRGCELCQFATQTVFGAGPDTAQIMIVGEQPGDIEDQRGVPFVGPAGQLLEAAFEEAGLSRSSVYLTNAVKHFHFQERGKQRLHKTPSSRHINACRPWLEAEVALIQPKMLVCLGATALHAVIGSMFRISDIRGQIVASPLCEQTMVTWHPAAILRALPEQRVAKQQELVEDLRRCKV